VAPRVDVRARLEEQIHHLAVSPVHRRQQERGPERAIRNRIVQAPAQLGVPRDQRACGAGVAVRDRGRQSLERIG
jgi:hypothetical protein